MNKITYPSEIAMSESIDVSMSNIKNLEQGILDTDDDIVKEALQSVIDEEKKAVNMVMAWVDIH